MSAALIYQHESLGADQAITDVIDRHLQSEQTDDEDEDGEGSSHICPARGNCG